MLAFTEWVSAIALGACALLGMGAMIAPKWAAGIVRLQADPAPDKPGGYSEFRATYGGLLLFLHLTALAIMVQPGLSTPLKLFAVLPIAMGWVGAGTGRFMSLLLDSKDNRSAGMIPVWIPTEVALGLAIAAPILQLGT